MHGTKEGKFKLKVTTLNVRSLRSKQKQEEVVQLMLSTQTDFLIITESWLNYSVLNAFEGVKVAQTPPSESKGVLVLTGKEISNLQPVLPSLWTPHTIMLKAHVKSIGDSITIVGHYS